MGPDPELDPDVDPDVEGGGDGGSDPYDGGDDDGGGGDGNDAGGDDDDGGGGYDGDGYDGHYGDGDGYEIDTPGAEGPLAAPPPPPPPCPPGQVSTGIPLSMEEMECLQDALEAAFSEANRRYPSGDSRDRDRELYNLIFMAVFTAYLNENADCRSVTASISDRLEELAWRTAVFVDNRYWEFGYQPFLDGPPGSRTPNPNTTQDIVRCAPAEPGGAPYE